MSSALKISIVIPYAVSLDRANGKVYKLVSTQPASQGYGEAQFWRTNIDDRANWLTTLFPGYGWYSNSGTVKAKLVFLNGYYVKKYRIIPSERQYFDVYRGTTDNLRIEIPYVFGKFFELPEVDVTSETVYIEILEIDQEVPIYIPPPLPTGDSLLYLDIDSTGQRQDIINFVIASIIENLGEENVLSNKSMDYYLDPSDFASFRAEDAEYWKAKAVRKFNRLILSPSVTTIAFNRNYISSTRYQTEITSIMVNVLNFMSGKPSGGVFQSAFSYRRGSALQYSNNLQNNELAEVVGKKYGAGLCRCLKEIIPNMEDITALSFSMPPATQLNQIPNAAEGFAERPGLPLNLVFLYIDYQTTMTPAPAAYEPPRVVVPAPPAPTLISVYTELYHRPSNTKTRRMGGKVQKISSSASPYTAPAYESAILIECGDTFSAAPTDFNSATTKFYEYKGNYDPSVTITLTATPDTGKVFDKWELPVSQYNNTVQDTGVTATTITISAADMKYLAGGQQTIAINMATDITAVFKEALDYKIAISPPGAGKIVLQKTDNTWVTDSTVSPTTYSIDTTITNASDYFQLQAIPNTHYVFSKWQSAWKQRKGSKVQNDSLWSSGQYEAMSANYGADIIHNSVNSLYNDWNGTGKKDFIDTAYFVDAPKVNLIFTIEGEGQAATPDFTYAGASGVPSSAHEYYQGDSFNIVASAEEHYHFVRWDGGILSTDSPFSLTMAKDYSITATFYPDPKLTVHIVGTGKVLSSDGGIDCTANQGAISGDNQEPYKTGTSTTLTASLVTTPYNEWYFSHWEGDFEGTSQSCTLTISANTTVTAVFKLYPFLSIRVLEGSGTIIGYPPSVLGGAFTASGDSGNMKVCRTGSEYLSAVPGSGWRLQRWSGDIIDYRPNLTVIMLGVSKTVYAHFIRVYHLTLNVNPQNVGTVYDSDWIYETDDSLTAEVDTGKSVKLMAFQTNYEYIFSHWTSTPNTYSGETTNPLTVSDISEDTTITANFDRIQYSVHVVISPAGCGGSVTGNGFDVTTSDLLNFYINTEITLAATPPAEGGYLFYYWNGDFQTADNPLTFTLSQNIEIEAVFYQPTDWLVKRLSPAKKLSELWQAFAQVNERFWESNFDWALNRLKNMVSFYTSDLATKRRYVSEFQNYYKADFPQDNFEIFLSNRRNLIARKGQEGFYDEVLQGIDQDVTARWVPLYADSREPYGERFYTTDECNSADEHFFPTSRGFLEVNGFPLSPNSPDKWSDTLRKIVPIEIVIDGSRGFPFFAMDYESELNFEVIESYELYDGDNYRTVPNDLIYNNQFVGEFHKGNKIVYYYIAIKSALLQTVKIRVYDNTLNATLYAKWTPDVLPTETHFDEKAIGLSGQNFEIVLPASLGIGNYFFGLRADRAYVTEHTDTYPGNNGYYKNGGCKVMQKIG